MNKKIITCLCSSVFTLSLFITPLTVNASTINTSIADSEAGTQSQQKLKILQKEVINSLTSDQINFYKYVEKVKADNIKLSPEEIVALIDILGIT
jgi:peptidoglycan hydrolase CwlO-like protein